MSELTARARAFSALMTDIGDGAKLGSRDVKVMLSHAMAYLRDLLAEVDAYEDSEAHERLSAALDRMPAPDAVDRLIARLAECPCCGEPSGDGRTWCAACQASRCDAIRDRIAGEVTAPGFYEDDEPLQDVIAAFEAGERGVTRPEAPMPAGVAAAVAASLSGPWYPNGHALRPPGPVDLGDDPDGDNGGGE